MATDMINLDDKRLWLLLASGLLAIAAPLLYLWPDQKPLPIADWPAPTPLVIGAPKSSASSDRQLFVAGDPKPDPAAEQVAQPPKLLGIAKRIRGKGVAVVRLTSGETESLYVGDQADGWTLTALTPKDATFTGPSGNVTISLDFSNREPSAGVTPPAQNPQAQRTQN